jgi:hypothetical protein
VHYCAWMLWHTHRIDRLMSKHLMWTFTVSHGIKYFHPPQISPEVTNSLGLWPAHLNPVRLPKWPQKSQISRSLLQPLVHVRKQARSSWQLLRTHSLHPLRPRLFRAQPHRNLGRNREARRRAARHATSLSQCQTRCHNLWRKGCRY